MSESSWIDISVPLRAGMPAWPGSVGLRLSRTLDLGSGDPVNNSRLECDVHVGTHVDAPLHHFEAGDDVASLNLDDLIGLARVVELLDVDSVQRSDLEALRLPTSTARLLLKTRNSALWSDVDAHFCESYVALTLDAARWVVERGIRLVGIDYLSVQRFGDGPETHQVLLSAGVIVLEGVDLSQVAPGDYELVCLPLRLTGGDGAPARAALRRQNR
jgi:arylformamidase